MTSPTPTVWERSAFLLQPLPDGAEFAVWHNGIVVEQGTVPAAQLPALLARQRGAGHVAWTFAGDGTEDARALRDWLPVLFPELPDHDANAAAAAAGLTVTGLPALLALYRRCAQRWNALPLPVLREVVPLLDGVSHPHAPEWRRLLVRRMQAELDAAVQGAAPGPAMRAEPQEGVTLTGSAAYFGARGLLARDLGMEVRPAQERMAQGVEDALNDGALLAVEAGCGVGKSLAYGLPLFRWCAATKEQAVVSTNTRNLQEQLDRRDFPQLQKILAREQLGVNWCVLKGREHYLCPRRLRALLRQPPADPAAASRLAGLVVWEHFSAACDLDELSWLAQPEQRELRRDLGSSYDGCLRRFCGFRNRCHLRRARERARLADIVLVNHTLLLTDARAAQRLLPPYRRLVVDEAHHLERVAAEELGVAAVYWDLHNLVQRLSSGPKRDAHGLLAEARRPLKPDAPEHDLLDAAQRAAAGALAAAEYFFRELRQAFFPDAQSPVARLRLHATMPDQWPQGAQHDLQQALTLLLAAADGILRRWPDDGSGEEPEWRQELAGWREACTQWRDAFAFLCARDDAAMVYWVERRQHFAHLQAAPRQVGPALRQALYERCATAVFASATLTVAGEFTYWAERVGLAGDARLRVLRLPEVFDYARQVSAAVVRYIPHPEKEDHAAEVAELIAQAARRTTGGLLALFTSYRALNAAAARLRGRLEPGRLLVHGESGSRAALVDAMRRQPGLVLLGTSSLWEGIDLPGDALQTVLMVKLPFTVPDDPLHQAQCEDLRAAGRDPFAECSVPQMAIRLRQGFGRLIRTQQDRGYFLLLDGRALTRGYGLTVRASLPVAQWHELTDASQLPAYFAGTLPRPATAEADGGEQQALFERLKRLRWQLAQQEQVKPWEVFPDATLKALVYARPRTLAEMRQVKGIRDKKLAKYGEVFLAALLDDAD